MLEPLGSPLADGAVSALRGESGMLGRLSVPLRWGTAVPPDNPKPAIPTVIDAEPVPGLLTADGLDTETAGMDEWGEWAEWAEFDEWDANSAEPRFDVPRGHNVVPHSPAAG